MKPRTLAQIAASLHKLGFKMSSGDYGKGSFCYIKSNGPYQWEEFNEGERKVVGREIKVLLSIDSFVIKSSSVYFEKENGALYRSLGKSITLNIARI